MSTTKQAPLDRKAALEQLKFKRTKGANRPPPPPAATATSSSSSSVLSPVSSISTSSWSAPPTQSRDATSGLTSRYFSSTSGPRGTVLVPNSSPISISSSSPPPSNGYRPPPPPPVPRGRPPLSADPIAGPSQFTLPSSLSRASFPSPSRHATSPERPPSILPAGSPGSPEVTRMGQRRRGGAPSHRPILSTSSDDALPQASEHLERAARAPISSTSSSSKQSEEDKKRFNKFRMTFVEFEGPKVTAAWEHAGQDEKKAEALLKDTNWVWKKASPPKAQAPTSGSGRAKEVEERQKALRDAGKERAKKSMIYAGRVELEKRDESPTPTQQRPPSPTSPEVGPRRRIKRGRVAIESDEDEDDASTPASDAGPSRLKRRIVSVSDEEESKPSPKPIEAPRPPSRAPKSDAQAALEYLNSQGVDALRELTGCTEAQAQKIIELRPYASVADLKERLGQGKKKAGPLKISPRMFEDCVETFEGYSAIDDVLEQCESIGASLQAHIARWQGPPKGKAKATLSSDLWEDGALSMHSAAGVSSRDYLSKQPASMSSDLQLKEYQLLGLNWLRLMHMKGHSAILADEMGLGKTVQVISFLAHLHETGNKGPHLIVVPASTLENWVREFNKFAPSVKVQTYYGKKDERSELRQRLLDTMRSRHAGGWEVLITTYQLASGDDRDRKFMRKIDWEACIFDEGHTLKNYQSNVYKSLIKFGSRWKLLLTGTPLQNNLQELVSLLNFILPKILGPEMDALRAVFKTKGDSKVALLAKERVDRAKRMMTPFVLRRRKEHVLKDLPEKHERIEWCEMTPLQRTLYDEALMRSRKTVLDIDPAEIEDKPVPKKMPRAKDKRYLENSANVLMDLRKASSHPLLFRTRFADRTLNQLARLLVKEEAWKGYKVSEIKEDLELMSDMELQRLCYSYNSTQQYMLDPQCYYETGKVTVLLKLLDRYMAEGRKVLLFSQFVQNLDILVAMLDHKNIRHLVLTGSTPVDQRQALVDEFTEDDDIPLFLLSTKAGGMGINLTAASAVILFDQDFNPHNDRQAQDRAYRIGQKRSVDVVKLITRESIEEDMLRLGQTKLALDAAVAADGEAAENVERQLKTSLMSMLRKQAGESQGQGHVQPMDIDG